MGELPSRGIVASPQPGGATRLLRAVAWVAVARVLGMGMGLATTILVARVYGKEATGLVALINATAVVFATAAGAGLPVFLLRVFSDGERPEDRWRHLQLYRRALWLVLGIALLLLAPVLVALFGRFPGFAREMPGLALSIVAAALLGRVLMALAVSVSRALLPVPAYAGLLLLPIAANLAIVAVWLLLAPPLPILPSAALAFGVGLTGAVAVFAGMLRLGKARHAQDPGDAILSPRQMLAAGAPFLLASGASVLVMDGNIVVSGFLLPTAEVGIYAVAHKLSLLTSFALSSVSLVAQPQFARLRAQGDREALQHYGRQVSRLIFWSSVPIILGLFLARHGLMQWGFGAGFADATAPLTVLLVGQAVAALTGATNPYLSMTGGQHLLARIITVAAVLSIVLNLLLTPWLGVIGPAVAMTASLVFWNTATLLTIRLRDGLWLCWVPGIFAARRGAES
ncbi:oligosaccharide flippase family protein [Pseudodonghicola flavimaris]|uniref:Polysaccharide biosynthesis C-terminal domain-containing protein n=1 Tax=Pseudodonghicola flavimaris TaxID=3050036 RepID=A0ABT7F3A6_9RHOB|nr:polysaccharide biosynthesis C-terminal domain-containing protein [Pseudodonghicola flavimaris]MDK3019097.1 polysaccharide biosynthesis C-terminal domain-containing protein [Pseudodonghicola flavimaris]